MKNKTFFIAALALLASLVAANISLAWGGGFSDPCSGSFWAQQCQQFIHDRDVYNNLKQIPNFEFGNYGGSFGGSGYGGYSHHHPNGSNGSRRPHMLQNSGY